MPFSDPVVTAEQWAALHPDAAAQIGQGRQGAPP
jgi:hypothetical protein